MSAVICKGCGGVTNTITSNYWDNCANDHPEATECYARVNEQKKEWEEGCALARCSDTLTKVVVGKIIGMKIRKDENGW